MSNPAQRQRLAALVAAGDLAAAERLLKRWQTEQPNQLEPRLLRSRLSLLLGQYRDARDRATQAVGRYHCPPALALDALNCLRSFAAHDEMIAFGEGYALCKDMSAQDLALAASTLSSVGASALARQWVDLAVAKSPDDSVCRVNRALVHIYSARVDEAERDLEYVIDGAQDSAMAHWLLARLRKQDAHTQHVARLRDRSSRTGLHAVDRAFLDFALFKGLDDLGETDAAMNALNDGCASMRGERRYNAHGHTQLCDAIVQAFANYTALDPGTIAGGHVPIFIVGMHRSGTTLLERLLGASPDVYDYGESERLAVAIRYAANTCGHELIDVPMLTGVPRLDFAEVGKFYLALGKRRIAASRFATEKNPGYFQHIGFIRHALPQAKVLHMRRAPMDLCFANLREMFGAAVTHSYDQQYLAHYHGQYQRLMQFWHQQFPGFVLDVDYETLVRDPIAESKRIFAFCGLDWQPGIVDIATRSQQAITTLSALQIRQPIHTASIDRYKAYAHHLGPLQEALLAQARDRTVLPLPDTA
jgi:tetratricopeptide (TPR) repeat protein